MNLLPGLPLALFAMFLADSLVSRSWRRLAGLLTGSILLSALAATAFLFYDWRTGSLAFYSTDGWYILWFGAASLMGAIALAAWLLRPVLRMIARVMGRQTQGLPSKGLAPVAGEV